MYACLMDPEIISENTGKCPKCGMELVALNADDHHGHKDPISAEKDFKIRFFITLPFVLIAMLLSADIQKWTGLIIVFPAKELVLFAIGSFITAHGGLPFFRAAGGEISTGNFGMMTLVALAITVGYLFSVAATFLFPAGQSLYWEISTLISVFLFGHWLEMKAVSGVTHALTELAKLIPPTVHLVKSAGVILDVKTAGVNVGDKILVKPGEKIPVDGIITEGESLIDESMITGESQPILKKKSDTVIGGTLNQDGSLTVEVTKTGADTAVSQIMELIRQAQSSKPTVQLLADRAANILTFVAIIAGISAFVWWFYIFPHGAVFAATLAVSAIVVACPHALGLAIPVVTAITSLKAAKSGILIKNMKALEIARNTNYVVFDKTGTLTEGKFGVVDIIQTQNSKLRTQNDLLRLAAAVEIHSEHSIARGIVGQAKEQNMSIPEVKDFKSYPGRGASGMVEGKSVTVGNRKLFIESGLEKQLNIPRESIASGKTPVYIVIDNQPEGMILLADIIRKESKEAIQKLHKMGIKTAMLTGDTRDVAMEVGSLLAVNTVFAELLPGDKVKKVKELQNRGYVVAMVGDGVNDAPTLTSAHVGIAIGAGTDVAIESADIILMKNDLRDVVKAISLSRKTHTKMVQNLIWATGYNLFAVPIAAGALYPSLGILLKPEWSALLMSVSSLIVVFNALLLRKTRLN